MYMYLCIPILLWFVNDLNALECSTLWTSLSYNANSWKSTYSFLLISKSLKDKKMGNSTIITEIRKDGYFSEPWVYFCIFSRFYTPACSLRLDRQVGLVQISTFQQFDVYVYAHVQLKTGRKSKASYATLNYKKTIICTMYSKNVNSYANTRFVMTRYKNWQKKLTAVQKKFKIANLRPFLLIIFSF